LHSRDSGKYTLSQGPLEYENTNPFIIFGPPTPPGETPGGGLYKSRLNATPPAPAPQKNWTETTWGQNRILKYTGDREEWFNSTPEGYNNVEGLEWEESKYNTTQALTDEEAKEVREKAADLARLSAHKHLEKSVWMSQKSIYPVKDSHSYITPYFQRDHAWTEGQHDVADEVKWSRETNATAADHLDWVVNGPATRLNTSPATLAQQKSKWTQYLPIRSRLVAYDAREDAWNDEQADNTNEDEWKNFITSVGADYFDSANTATETIAPNADKTAWTNFAQKKKEIYPVKDSHSYITPYFQRDHAWTEGQHDVADEVKWSRETNATAADHLDWVVNGPATRLNTAAATLAQKNHKWTQFLPIQSRISREDPRNDAWTDEQDSHSNEDEYKDHIVTVGADYYDSANTAGSITPNADANAWNNFAQKKKEIYPVKDSHSYITPYFQRDHAWTEGQHDVADEVKWSRETNATAADHLDWVVNGPATRLNTAAATLAQKKSKWTKFTPVQSKIASYD
jgi:hypothetical protein